MYCMCVVRCSVPELFLAVRNLKHCAMDAKAWLCTRSAADCMACMDFGMVAVPLSLGQPFPCANSGRACPAHLHQRLQMQHDSNAS